MTSRGLLAGIALAIALTAAGRPARAQSDDDLKVARELFAEAYKDEQEKRYDQALEKFNRVAKVKESPSVRYRIASVLEALGRLRESRDSFRALASQKGTMPAKDQPIADSSAERAAALDKKIPHLVLKLPANAPPDARVTVDGASVPVSTTARAIELDPGEHVVHGTGSTTKSYEAKVTLVEGNEVPLEVPFEPKNAVVEKPLPPPPPDPPNPNRNLAYIALGAGGVLLVSGIALLLVRESDITDINHKCPNGNCPSTNKDDIQSTHDQAALFGPLGVTCTLLGLASAGAGVYLLVKKPAAAASPTPGSASPTSPTPSSLNVGPHIVHGGAVFRVGTSF